MILRFSTTVGKAPRKKKKSLKVHNYNMETPKKKGINYCENFQQLTASG